MSQYEQAVHDTPTVLLVDDDDAFRERLGKALRDRGYDVRTADCYEKAMQTARTNSPDYAVVDLCMPGRSGLELVRDLAQLDLSTRIIILTGYGSIATAVDGVRLGALQYLTKPADADDLVAAFERAAQPPLTEGRVNDEEVPSLARVEQQHLQRVLGACDGNISETARRLGLHRRSLQRKLSK